MLNLTAQCTAVVLIEETAKWVKGVGGKDLEPRGAGRVQEQERGETI